jgi:hypothetical protein
MAYKCISINKLFTENVNINLENININKEQGLWLKTDQTVQTIFRPIKGVLSLGMATNR